jgi:hypothetical protein
MTTIFMTAPQRQLRLCAAFSASFTTALGSDRLTSPFFDMMIFGDVRQQSQAPPATRHTSTPSFARAVADAQATSTAPAGV